MAEILPGLDPHDIKRTFRSIKGESAPLAIVGEILQARKGRLPSLPPSKAGIKAASQIGARRAKQTIEIGIASIL